MQWMIDKETQTKLITAGKGGVPIRTSSFSMPQLGGDKAAYYDAMKSTLAVAVAKPKAPKIFQIYDALGPIVQQVGQGKLTPAEGAKEGQAAMLAICKACLL